MTNCPHPTKIIEPIWLEENGQRTLLAKVDYCPQHWEGKSRVGCDRPIGEPRREKDATQDFASGWRLMVQHHAHAPYFFERQGGFLVPQGVKLDQEPERED